MTMIANDLKPLRIYRKKKQWHKKTNRSKLLEIADTLSNQLQAESIKDWGYLMML